MSNPTTTEQSVESAMAELREMFPRDYWIRIDQSVFDEPAMNEGIVRRVTISIDKIVGDFEAPTLNEAMDQVRAWHREQQEAKR